MNYIQKRKANGIYYRSAVFIKRMLLYYYNYNVVILLLLLLLFVLDFPKPT